MQRTTQRCLRVLAAFGVVLLGCAYPGVRPWVYADVLQSYTVEKINDPDFLLYPPPPPVHHTSYEFTIVDGSHDEVINVPSTQLRNISITLENTGSTLIRAPYLYGPHGYDFRDLSKLAATIAAGDSLTNAEKFFRVHEWLDEHFVRTEVLDDDPLRGMDGTLRRLNQYGGS